VDMITPHTTRKRWWEWKPVFRLDPRRSALLVIDMQKGFTSKGAPFEVPMARAQLKKIAELVLFARSIKLPVIFTKFAISKSFNYPFYWEIAKQRGLKLGATNRNFWPGTKEWELDDELKATESDIVVEKYGYDAFANTTLEQYLRARDVEYLIVCGTVVNWCVDSTVRSAFHRFYKVTVAADGVSGYDHAGLTGSQWQEAELDLFAEAFARVMTIEDIIRELRSKIDKLREAPVRLLR
jgi:nicotinamidase-related amidase